MDNRLNEVYYSKIANKLNSLMLPVEWSKICFYAEVETGATSIWFYFQDHFSGRYTQGPELYERFGVNRTDYKMSIGEISDFVLDLNSDFVKNIQERWTNISLILERTGKFKAQFGYENLLENTQVQRRNTWMKKYLV